MEILVYPNPFLRKPAENVAAVKDVIGDVEGMLRTMRDNRGVGLAATQVGIGKRFFVMNPQGQPDTEQVLINPTIVEGRGEVIEMEGCLSLPGLEARVPRYEWVRLQATLPDGEEIELAGDDLFARGVQHEIDHLDGTLLIDKVSAAARIGLKPRLKELERRYRE